MPAKANTIDEYLARVPLDRRRALEKLRATIRSLLPDAEECISYSMPAFRHGGYVIAGFLATSKGCSYFPFSGTTLATLASDLRAYGQTKSALHFDPERPLPKALVKKLLQVRMAETNGARGSRRTKRREPAPATSERTRAVSKPKRRERSVTPSKRARSASKAKHRARSRSEKS